MIIDKFYSNINNSIITTSDLIEILNKKKNIPIEDLYKELKYKNSQVTIELIIEALGLLYLTGKLDFDKNTGILELIKWN